MSIYMHNWLLTRETSLAAHHDLVPSLLRRSGISKTILVPMKPNFASLESSLVTPLFDFNNTSHRL
jgi:hypothetical protein